MRGTARTAICLAVQLDFVRLHHLLDGGANLVEPRIDTSFLQQVNVMDQPGARTRMPVLVASFTALTSGSYLGLKWTVQAQSMMRPVRVRTATATLRPTVHVRAKVDLAHVVVLQR